jgi:phosphatidylserine decarboxylase
MLLTTLLIFAVILATSMVMLGRKWQLKPRHYLPWMLAMVFVGCFILAGLARGLPFIPAWLAVGLSLGTCYLMTLCAILYCFFRDPNRTAPGDDSRIISPADGTIVYIKPIDNGLFPFAVKGRNKIPLSDFVDGGFVPEHGVQIGIGMNFLNVHVNRSPISGTVKMVRRIPGTFASLKHLASLLENERVLTIVQNKDFALGIVQIASRLVRRISPYVAEGQHIVQGQRLGIIRFGSQVDLLIPKQSGLQVVAAIGDEVTAGESVLATRRSGQVQVDVSTAPDDTKCELAQKRSPCVMPLKIR